MDIVLLILLYSVVSLTVIWCVLQSYFHSVTSDYFTSRGVPYERYPWGNLLEVVFNKRSLDIVCSEMYRQYKHNKLVAFLFWRTPAVFILDPQLAETVLVQDFSNFHDRGVPHNPNEPMSESLSILSGQKWRHLRYKLIPAFSSGKVRAMLEQILKCGDFALEHIEEDSATQREVEMEQMAFKYTTQAMGSCMAGIELQSDSKLWSTFKNVLNIATKLSLYSRLKALLAIANPKLLILLNIQIIDRRVTKFFLDLTQSAIKCRGFTKRKRHDVLQLMLTLKEEEDREKKAIVGNNFSAIDANGDFDTAYSCKSSVEIELPKEAIFTENCIASTLFNFVSGGNKPIVNTIIFALFELARNHSTQEIAQNEIDFCIAKHKGLTYEAIRDMIYIDQIVQETLRLYTPVPLISRKVTGDFQMPGTDFVLKPGNFIYVPIAAIHKDPQNYPDPESFNPDRFAGNNYKSSVLYMPFGHGPRMCIAIKFAVVTMKVYLAKILSKYSVRLGRKLHLPLRFDGSYYIMKLEGGMWLSVHPRDAHS
ncbi:cytochrome P450 6a2-like [Homalodisca vitripennis]|uniref:cytochrome P450 6a2-like n=1 Tax=Homalodisca vitripennis TaxID=197043 RepID=UPI001EECD67C|nr:cytochrome P450 6a2-like [Homalodisca vitripennis]